jgi:arginine deiminase
MRTNLEAIKQIMEADAFGHDTIAVVNDHKWWQMQMHLDTYFNIIDKDLCTLVESRYNAKKGDPEWVTVDLYTRKSGEKEYVLTQKNLSFVNFLKERGFTIIPIKQEDELHYANNFLTIAPRHIMAVGNQSEELQKSLAEHGVKVEWIPLENLIKGYGAAHCMTQVMSAVEAR